MLLGVRDLTPGWIPGRQMPRRYAQQGQDRMALASQVARNRAANKSAGAADEDSHGISLRYIMDGVLCKCTRFWFDPRLPATMLSAKEGENE